MHGGSLWAEQADGANQQVLVMAPAGRQLTSPRWSPDGTRLAYESSPRSEITESQIVVWDGLASQPVTPDAEARRRVARLVAGRDADRVHATRELKDRSSSAIVVRTWPRARRR